MNPIQNNKFGNTHKRKNKTKLGEKKTNKKYLFRFINIEQINSILQNKIEIKVKKIK